MTDPTSIQDPGFGRDPDLERARDAPPRPADADMDALRREAEREPARPPRVSPDPDDPSGVNGGVTGED